MKIIHFIKIFSLNILVFLSIVIFLSCSSEGDDGRLMPISEKGQRMVQSQEAFVAEASMKIASDNSYGEGGSQSSYSLLADRMIVHNVNLSLKVRDVQKEIEKIKDIAKENFGYVVNSNLIDNEYDFQGYVSIRIPSERLTTVLSGIKLLGEKIVSENWNSRDVTEEYIDLQARLGNLKNTEKQYLRLMERTETIKDILLVQKELTIVRSQIEQLQGRINYLDKTTSTSLINVTVMPVSMPVEIVDSGWQPIEIIKSALRGLAKFGQSIVNLLIILGVFSPVWIVILALLYWIIRRRRNVNSK